MVRERGVGEDTMNYYCNNIISKKRFNEVQKHYAKKEGHISNDENLKWVSNFAEIVSEFTNHKLTTSVIMDSADYLDDMLCCSRDEIANGQDKKGAGRLMLKLINEMPRLDSLTEEEKRWLAFCVITQYYPIVHSDNSNEKHKGLVLFTSVERIKAEYNENNGFQYFETRDQLPGYDPSESFGYSVKNPILAVFKRNLAFYLTKLMPKEGRLTVLQIDTVRGAFGEPLIKYEITVRKKPFSREGEKKRILYVNECSMENSNKAPEGFEFNTIDFECYKKGTVSSSYFRVTDKNIFWEISRYRLRGQESYGCYYDNIGYGYGVRKNTVNIKSPSPLHYVPTGNVDGKQELFDEFLIELQKILPGDESAVFTQDFCEEDGRCCYRVITVATSNGIEKVLLAEDSLNLTDKIIIDLKLEIEIRNLQNQNDEKFKELLLSWNREIDPELKDQKAKAVEEYRKERDKKIAIQEDQEDWDRRMEEVRRESKELERKAKEEKTRKEKAWKQRLLNLKKDPEWEQLSKKFPVKHILYCNYPGLEFKEEINAKDIDYDYFDEYNGYSDVLYDFINNVLINLDLEKYLEVFFTEDQVPASGYICYDDVRTDVFGNGTISLNENIKIYLDNIREDGEVIDTEEINIEDYVDLESEKETLMECGFWAETDEYIQTSIKKFVDESDWHYALRNGDDEIEDIEEWPAPNKDGTWGDEDDIEMHPYVWFGEGDDRWDLDGDNLEFWQTENPHGTVVEYSYDAFAGCYGGGIPGFEDVVKRCPIKIEDDDTPESIDKKIQTFFVEQYKKAHA